MIAVIFVLAIVATVALAFYLDTHNEDSRESSHRITIVMRATINGRVYRHARIGVSPIRKGRAAIITVTPTAPVVRS